MIPEDINIPEETTKEVQKRRTFLKNSGFSLASLGFPKSIADFINNITEAPEANVTNAKLSKEIKGMPSCVRRFEVQIEINGQYHRAGQFFSLESSGKVSMVTKAQNPSLFNQNYNGERDFKAIKNHFSNTALMFAGPFTHNWRDIEGIAMQNGVNVGQNISEITANTLKNHKGFAIISPNGNLSFKYFPDLKISDLKNMLNQAQNTNQTLFQQHMALFNGQICWQDGSLNGKNKNLLVERVVNGTKAIGMLNLKGKVNGNAISMGDAGKILQQLHIENALYCDVGAVEGAALVNASGKIEPINDASTNKEKYTNMIAFHG